MKTFELAFLELQLAEAIFDYERCKAHALPTPPQVIRGLAIRISCLERQIERMRRKQDDLTMAE